MIKKLKKFPFLQMAGVLAIFLFIGSVLFWSVWASVCQT